PVRHRPTLLHVSRSMRRVSHLPAVHRRGRRRQATPSPAAVTNWSLASVTGYCATGNRNAAGNWPTIGTAAGNAWPLGTHLYVDTIGTVVIEDRSAPGATDVDLYMGAGANCLTAATNFGRRTLRIHLLTSGG